MHKRINALVLLLILLLVGGVVVVCVAKVQASAAMLSCQGNLKRVGFAIHAYHDQMNAGYPAGTVGNVDLPPEKRFSWLLSVEPYFESRPEWESGLNMNDAWDSVKNRAAFPPVPHLPVFCPGNPDRGPPGEPRFTHYIGVAGLGADAATLPVTDRRCGMFGYDRKTRRSDIKDKLAFTMMVAETRTENGPWAAGGPATVRGIDLDGPAYISRKGQFGWHSSSSGCNILMADGSVRFVKDSVNPKVIEALATMAGGEEVGDF